MEWFIVISIILFGTFLVIAEILFIPGVFVAGLIGVSLSAYGIVLSYKYFDSSIGTITLIGTILINIISLIMVFRGKSWDKFALKDIDTGKARENFEEKIKPQDQGVTISSLKPFGKALINDLILEVKTNGQFVEEGQAIKVILINGSTVIVEKIN